MAQFVAKVEKDQVRKDKINRPFINAQDADTGQFLTVYVKKGETIDLSKAAGKTVVFSGTVHPLGDNVKLIARSMEIVK